MRCCVYINKEAIMKYSQCICCGEAFSENNVFTEAGWREAKISGMCEECFDALFNDDQDLDEDNNGFDCL